MASKWKICIILLPSSNKILDKIEAMYYNTSSKMSLPFLQSFGLTENESNLYELLLRLGESPAWKIVAEAKLKRPTVYKTLQSLTRRGLVETNTKEKVIRFKPEAPTKLLELAERQFQNLERAKENLQTTLPQLTSSYITAVEKPVVTTFEGIKGLQEIYEDTLKEAKPIYAVLQPVDVEPTLHKWLNTTYVKKRAKLKIPAQVIVSAIRGSKEYIERSNEEYRTAVSVPSDRFPFQHEIDIYSDKVAFINYKKGEALIGIVIKHPSIAQTMKAWFDLAWEGAKL